MLLLLISLSVISSCKQAPAPPTFYGQAFDTMQVLSVAEMVAKMEGRARVEVVVKGVITESCQAEGCWLNLKNENGANVFVDWNREFNIPQDVAGRQAMAKGYAYIDTAQSPPAIAFKATGVFL